MNVIELIAGLLDVPDGFWEVACSDHESDRVEEFHGKREILLHHLSWQ